MAKNCKRHKVRKHSTTSPSETSVNSSLDSSSSSSIISNELSEDLSFSADTSSDVQTPHSSREGMISVNDFPNTACVYCGISVSRPYRLTVHLEKCIFKIPEYIESSNHMQIPRIKIVKDYKKLSNMLNFAAVEDLYEYNKTAGLCIPGVYPLVFLGPAHFGRRIPPIIDKTASYKSFDILFRLLRLHGKVTLHNSLIILDERTGQESYLCPRLLIPQSPKVEVIAGDISTTTVALKKVLEDDSSSYDENIESNEDDELVVIYPTESEREPEHHTPPLNENEDLLTVENLPIEHRLYLQNMFPLNGYQILDTCSDDQQENVINDVAGL